MSHYLDLPPEDQRDILQEMYVDDGMILKDIAQELDIKTNTATQHAKKYGIKTRTKTEHIAMLRARGEESHPKERRDRQKRAIKAFWTEEKKQEARDKAWEHILANQPERLEKMAGQHSARLKAIGETGLQLHDKLLNVLEQSHTVHEYHLFSRSVIVAPIFIEELEVVLYFMGPLNRTGRTPVLEKKRQDLLTQRGISVINIEYESESVLDKVDVICQMIDRATDSRKNFVMWIGV